MNVKVCRIIFCATVLSALGSIQASASTVGVGTCTNFPYYTTIQTAVNSSPAGTVIEICPGSYPEQVTINKKLTLRGVVNSQSQEAPVIVSPAGGMLANASDFDNGNFPIAAQLLVENTSGVVISNLAVDAAGNGLSGCGTDVMGILFQNASGTLNYVAARNQTLDPADAGCQAGEGIFVETQNGFSSTVIVEDSSVHNYQKNGITGNDLGTSITISFDDVQGWGPTPAIAQNGIQVCCGATGKITSNVVIDDVYTGPYYGSSGILLYDTLENGGLSVSMNTVGNTQFPVVLYTDEFAANQYGDGVTVSSNRIFGAVDFDAIDACTNGNTITKNSVMNSWDSAIHLDASCSGSGNNTGNNNSVTSNTVNESECAGLLADAGTTGNVTAPNTFFNVNYTLTNSTSGCLFGPTHLSRDRGQHPFSPKGRPQKSATGGR